MPSQPSSERVARPWQQPCRRCSPRHSRHPPPPPRLPDEGRNQTQSETQSGTASASSLTCTAAFRPLAMTGLGSWKTAIAAAVAAFTRKSRRLLLSPLWTLLTGNRSDDTSGNIVSAKSRRRPRRVAIGEASRSSRNRARAPRAVMCNRVKPGYRYRYTTGVRPFAREVAHA